MEKRVNIWLEEEAHKQAKVISVIKNVKLGKYLEEAIEKAVEHDEGLINKIKI